MPRGKEGERGAGSTSATVGYEAELWRMADVLRGRIDPAEYKHVVLSLIFRKYISDAFEEQHAKLIADHRSHPNGDCTLTNWQFRDSDWSGKLLRHDKRWKYGVPPVGNANFAWVQHIIHHLAPAGVAGFVLANGSMSSNQSGEREVRKKIVEADLSDCMVALPGQLFYSTQIRACLWFLAPDRTNGQFRDRRGQMLFIDARKLGRMVDRTHCELTAEDIARIATTYHAWRGEEEAGYAK